MKFRLGFRIALVLVVLALTLSGEGVEAQRAGKVIKIEYFENEKQKGSYGVCWIKLCRIYL